MRRSLPVLLAVPLVLAGCGSEDPADPAQVLEQVEVSDAGEGEAPQVVLEETPLSVEETATEVLRDGEGPPVEAGQLVGVDYVGVNGADGEQFDASEWSGTPISFTLDDSVIPGFTTALQGVPVGSRVLAAIAPQDGYGPQGGVEAAGIGAEDTLVFVIDVVSASPARAAGEAVTPPAGLPGVTLAEDGAPTITIPQGAQPPSELVAQELIRGTGPQVQSGQTVTVHYTGVKWADGSVFDSSWENGAPVPFQIGTGQVIPGWDTGLVGRTVGSQVLLVIPPAQGYGEAGAPDAGISGTDTLVFVVDVLAAA
ncbi:FKBP-type peptidyl-prolyl cis-trans isomerase [Quadrisphaera sp. DSM 44207]|uniref:FKBP-type peptidyl-prolyl cis-trans isomerase n=1 Tax=Quadrisphaera sp. DSM 44207 TaxID=1881057 RepID=UPI000881CF5E|nr:FKBP-type peptidyl-prolyl cis-trans isomerase [Quadrisphaera sp. DSM 44207]SDQ40302.1 peptidylprolyl isomerase [Quadrisphaera sp. DSM 44207]